MLSILGILDSDWQGEYFLADNVVHSLPYKKRQALARSRRAARVDPMTTLRTE